MTNYRQTMADALEFMHLMREYKLMERELTDTEKKKREEIAQDMDDADFKERYGDRWKEVKMAVATKQAKEEFDLDEGKFERDMMTARSISLQIRIIGTARNMIDDGKSDSEIMKTTKLSAGDVKKLRQDMSDRPGEYDEEFDLDEEGELDESLSGDVKKWFAKKGLKGIKVKTVSGKNPFMQVSRGSNDKIPNDIIKKAITLQYDKVPGSVRDPDNIEYGNFGSRMFSLSLDKMAELVKEEVDLDEVRQLKNPKKEVLVVKSGKVIVIDKKDAKEYLNKGWDLAEEVELDEAKMSSSQIAQLKKAYEPMRDKRISTDNANKLSAMMDKVGKDKETLIQLFKADIPFVSQIAVTKLISKHGMKGAEINKLKEEVEVDESARSDENIKVGDNVHLGFGAKGGAGFRGKVIKIDGENVHIKNPKGKEYKGPMKFVTIGESARSDAMRAIAKDKDLARGSDVEDDDDSATDVDIKGASKNIIMQMRKAISMRGNFKVEFEDNKKIKIPVKIAAAVQTKFNSFRKPSDKEKFQAKVAKSYKSMLSALKENTILDRISKKIQERKDG